MLTSHGSKPAGTCRQRAVGRLELSCAACPGVHSHSCRYRPWLLRTQEQDRLAPHPGGSLAPHHVQHRDRPARRARGTACRTPGARSRARHAQGTRSWACQLRAACCHRSERCSGVTRSRGGQSRRPRLCSARKASPPSAIHWPQPGSSYGSYRHLARTCVLTGRAARCLLRYARGRHDDRAPSFSCSPRSASPIAHPEPVLSGNAPSLLRTAAGANGADRCARATVRERTRTYLT